MKRQIITLFLCLTTTVAFAQRGGGEDDKVQKLKKNYIKEQLELTDAQAEKFFPVYDEYQNKREIIKLEQTLEFKKFQALNDPTEEQSNAFTDKMLELEQKEVDLKKEYTAKFKEIIGAQKTAMLFIVELEFKKKMLHMLKHKNGEPNNESEE